MKNAVKLLLMGVFSCGMTTGLAQADDILAVSWDGSTYTMDSTNGSGSFLGSSGFTGLNAMAGDGAGRFFTTSGSTLLTIDPNTGAGTTVGNTGLLSVRGMAMQPGGPIFVYNDEGFGNPDVFYSVDPNTGASSFIGRANHTGIQGLAFGTNGRLFAWDVTFGLLTVDITNGLTTDVNNANGGSGDIQCLALGPNGIMYGARNALFSINLNDGSFATIGTGNYSDVRGIEFLSPPADCLTMTVSTLIANQNATWKVSGATPGSRVAIVFGTQAGSTILNGQFGYCASFGIKGVTVNNIVGTMIADNAGNISIIKKVPAGTTGITALTQAAQQGTCPNECMSNLDTQVIQ